MFSVGEKVINKNGVACIIKDITTLNITGIDKTRLYYILSSIFTSTNTYYVPTDGEQAMRYVMSKDEAQLLVDSMNEIEPIAIQNNKYRELQYKDLLKTCEPKEWISLIMALRMMKEKRLSEGKKFTAVDERYLIKAENSLFGELEVSFEMAREEIEELMKKSCSRW